LTPDTTDANKNAVRVLDEVVLPAEIGS